MVTRGKPFGIKDGADLKRWRVNDRRMTQDRLAEFLGSTKRSVQNWEDGVVQMPLLLWRCLELLERCERLERRLLGDE